MPAHATMTTAAIAMPAIAPELKEDDELLDAWPGGVDEDGELGELLLVFVDDEELEELVGEAEVEADVDEAVKSCPTGGAKNVSFPGRLQSR